MVIQELKPSRQVQGRWLAVLEDGSILRLGEGEVVDFALFAGKELTEREAEGLTAAVNEIKPAHLAWYFTFELAALTAQLRAGGAFWTIRETVLPAMQEG